MDPHRRAGRPSVAPWRLAVLAWLGLAILMAVLLVVGVVLIRAVEAFAECLGPEPCADMAPADMRPFIAIGAIAVLAFLLALGLAFRPTTGLLRGSAVTGLAMTALLIGLRLAAPQDSGILDLATALSGLALVGSIVAQRQAAAASAPVGTAAAPDGGSGG